MAYRGSKDVFVKRYSAFSKALICAPTAKEAAHIVGYDENGKEIAHYLRHDGRVKKLSEEHLDELVEDLGICGYYTLSSLKRLAEKAEAEGDYRAAVVCLAEIHKRTNAYPDYRKQDKNIIQQVDRDMLVKLLKECGFNKNI